MALKSIRLSLIVYFLVLLVAAEGVAFWLVYHSAEAALREKQQTNRQLLDEQFRRLQGEEQRRFDLELFEQARDVASLSLRQWQWEKLHYVSFLPFGQVWPQSHVALTNLMLFAAPTRPGTNRPRDKVIAELLSTPAVPEQYLPKNPSGDVDYFQINAEWQPRPWTSDSLNKEEMAFNKDDVELFEPRHDDYTLADGRHVRRIMIKVTAGNRRGFRPRQGPNPAQPRPPQNGPPNQPAHEVAARPAGGRAAAQRGDRGFERRPERAPEVSAPWVIIQVARDISALERKLAPLRDDAAIALQAQDAAGRDSLAMLRRRLLAILGGTVLAMLLGGLVLGSYGLAPLQKLSDAVSRVSTRDFKLPLDPDERLPSELVPIRQRLQQTLDDLRKAFEREKQASADISHELRTPVASLLTTVEVALRKPRSTDEYRTTLEDVRGVGRQMRHLVERLLALARLDAGSDRPRLRSVDVGEVVHDSAALVRPLATERGLELRVHCPKPIEANTDPDKLREILVNLLHNAVQYNKPHGSIDVSADTAEGWLDLRVHDTGIGIRPDALNTVFERFYRADPSRHADDLHAGLGLSIVKGYVGLLGGTIDVESQVGQGSTFHVRLPTG